MLASIYQELALQKEADQEVIRHRIYALGVTATRLDNAVRGLSDDSGELSGAVKRWLEYGQALDRTNIIEEVGDCLWRLAQVCRAVGVTLEDAMHANLRKLDVRYPTGYEDGKAGEEDRNREAERRAVQNALRTVAQVMELRADPDKGCCEAFSHYRACRCLLDAQLLERDANVVKEDEARTA